MVVVAIEACFEVKSALRPTSSSYIWSLSFEIVHGEPGNHQFDQKSPAAERPDYSPRQTEARFDSLRANSLREVRPAEGWNTDIDLLGEVRGTVHS
jgi:hypothetical protein